ncbi:unnamed protein product [Prunus armeniaca]
MGGRVQEGVACIRLCQLGKGSGKGHRSEEQVWDVEDYALWLVNKAASGDKPSSLVEIPFQCVVYLQCTSYDLVPLSNSDGVDGGWHHALKEWCPHHPLR